MKFTEEQIEKFNKEKESFLEKINYFKEGVDFGENWCQAETRKKQWIDCLEKAVNSTDFLEKDLEDIEHTVVITDYLKNLETIILKEFSFIVRPFNVAIPEYRKKVCSLLLGIEVDK